MPETYPVSGRVIAPPGRLAPVTIIEFEPTDPNMRASGSIESDGSFTLKTLYFEKWLDGAAAGEHHVSITPMLDSGPGTPIVLKETYTIEPKKNFITIRID